MFFPDSGQAIKNKIQQSYNFLDPPILWRKKKTHTGMSKNPWDQILSICQKQGSECYPMV